MEKKFYVGQEVLCIKSHSNGVFLKGNRYTIQATKAGCCTHVTLQLQVNEVKLSHPIMGTICPDCGDTNLAGCFFSASCFIPIDNELSETTSEELIESLEIHLNPSKLKR